MNTTHIKEKLSEIIALEGTQPIDILASYIVGEFLGDYDTQYEGMYDENATLQQIGDLASDIEISNGTDTECTSMWNELKQLVASL